MIITKIGNTRTHVPKETFEFPYQMTANPAHFWPNMELHPKYHWTIKIRAWFFDYSNLSISEMIVPVNLSDINLQNTGKKPIYD